MVNVFRPAGVNSVTLLGRIGAPPQMRGSESHPVVNFTLATHTHQKLESGNVLTICNRNVQAYFPLNLTGNFIARFVHPCRRHPAENRVAPYRRLQALPPRHGVPLLRERTEGPRPGPHRLRRNHRRPGRATSHHHHHRRRRHISLQGGRRLRCRARENGESDGRALTFSCFFVLT